METIDVVVVESARLLGFDKLKELCYLAKIPLAFSA